MTSVPLNVVMEIFALVMAVGGVWVSLTNRITRIEERMEERQQRMDNEMQVHNKKLDLLQKTMSEILIKLENKVNR